LAEYLDHITTQKETYDIISLNYYDSELYADLIVKANPEYAGVLVFDANVRLSIPVMESVKPESAAPWRRP